MSETLDVLFEVEQTSLDVQFSVEQTSLDVQFSVEQTSLDVFFELLGENENAKRVDAEVFVMPQQRVDARCRIVGDGYLAVDSQFEKPFLVDARFKSFSLKFEFVPWPVRNTNYSLLRENIMFPSVVYPDRQITCLPFKIKNKCGIDLSNVVISVVSSNTISDSKLSYITDEDIPPLIPGNAVFPLIEFPTPFSGNPAPTVNFRRIGVGINAIPVYKDGFSPCAPFFTYTRRYNGAYSVFDSRGFEKPMGDWLFGGNTDPDYVSFLTAFPESAGALLAFGNQRFFSAGLPNSTSGGLNTAYFSYDSFTDKIDVAYPYIGGDRSWTPFYIDPSWNLIEKVKGTNFSVQLHQAAHEVMSNYYYDLLGYRWVGHGFWDGPNTAAYFVELGFTSVDEADFRVFNREKISAPQMFTLPNSCEQMIPLRKMARQAKINIGRLNNNESTDWIVSHQNVGKVTSEINVSLIIESNEI